MVFNSYIFIFLFFPICLLGYHGLLHYGRKEAAQLFLTVMSFWFYGYFRRSYLLIMVISICGNYLFHRLLSARRSKGILALSVAANLGLLFYFKYFDFFLMNINGIFGSSFPLQNIVLPLGISFFTFQQIGFLADTYMGEVQDCGFRQFVLFVSFFPQLIAGPIVSHKEMLPQFKKMGRDAFDTERFAKGLCLFVLGLFKKVLLADTLGVGVDYGYANLGLLGRWDMLIIIVAYALQLYFDFSGYCDMARGIGGMMGIQIPVNFNSPYKATNIVDFWKRWHITLNRFFTKYVYIPLGGNRRGRARMYANLLIVFFLSGLWHGAGWNFIFWGMMHGILYMVTRWYQYHRNAKTNVTGKGSVIDADVMIVSDQKPGIADVWNTIVTNVSRIFLLCYITVAWVFFRAKNLSQAFLVLKTLLLGESRKISLKLAECFRLNEFWYILKVLHLDTFSFGGYILMICMLAAGLYLAMGCGNAAEIADRTTDKAFSAFVYAVLFVWCVLSFSQVSTFLYFNF